MTVAVGVAASGVGLAATVAGDGSGAGNPVGVAAGAVGVLDSPVVLVGLGEMLAVPVEGAGSLPTCGAAVTVAVGDSAAVKPSLVEDGPLHALNPNASRHSAAV